MALDQAKTLINGIDQFHYGLVTENTVNSYKSEEMTHIEALREAQVSFQTISGDYYADNIKIIEESRLIGATLTVGLANFPLEDLSIVLGAEFIEDTEKGILKMTNKVTDKQADICVAFRISLTDGNFGYFKYMNGKAQISDETFTTADSNINYTDQTLVINFTPRSFDTALRDKFVAKKDAEIEIFGAETLTKGP